MLHCRSISNKFSALVKVPARGRFDRDPPEVIDQRLIVDLHLAGRFQLDLSDTLIERDLTRRPQGRSGREGLYAPDAQLTIWHRPVSGQSRPRFRKTSSSRSPLPTSGRTDSA